MHIGMYEAGQLVGKWLHQSMGLFPLTLASEFQRAFVIADRGNPPRPTGQSGGGSRHSRTSMEAMSTGLDVTHRTTR